MIKLYGAGTDYFELSFSGYGGQELTLLVDQVEVDYANKMISIQFLPENTLVGLDDCFRIEVIDLQSILDKLMSNRQAIELMEMTATGAIERVETFYCDISNTSWSWKYKIKELAL